MSFLSIESVVLKKSKTCSSGLVICYIFHVVVTSSIMHFVNIHLFHDESNFVAMEKVWIVIL